MVREMLMGVPSIESPARGFQAQGGDRRVDYWSEGVFDVIAF